MPWFIPYFGCTLITYTQNWVSFEEYTGACLLVSSPEPGPEWGPCPGQARHTGPVKVGSKFTDFSSKNGLWQPGRGHFLDAVKYKYWLKNCALGLQQSACIVGAMGLADLMFPKSRTIKQTTCLTWFLLFEFICSNYLEQTICWEGILTQFSN